MTERRAFDASESMRPASPAQQFSGTMFDAPKPVRRRRVVKEDAAAQAKSYLRGKLASLYRERQMAFQLGARSEIPFVTADDADRFLGEWAQKPVELAVRGNNWRGSLFKGGSWYRIAGKVVPSHRDRMNATDLSCWALMEEAA